MPARSAFPISANPLARRLMPQAISPLLAVAIGFALGLPAQAQVAQNAQGAGPGQMQGPQPAWRNIAEAPADFPVPIFRGSGTKFMSLTGLAPSRLPGSSAQLMLSTQDSPEVVANWYRAALTSCGLELNGAQMPAFRLANVKIIRADNQHRSITVSITRKQDAAGSATIVMLAAARK